MTKQKIVIVLSILALILAQIACDEAPSLTPGAPVPQASPIPEPPVKEIQGTPLPPTQTYEEGKGAKLWVFSDGLSLASLYAPTSKWGLVQIGSTSATIINPAGLLLLGTTGVIYAVIWLVGGENAFKAELTNGAIVAVPIPQPSTIRLDGTVNKRVVEMAFESVGAMFWCSGNSAFLYYRGVTKEFKLGKPCPPDEDEEGWMTLMRLLAGGNLPIQIYLDGR